MENQTNDFGRLYKHNLTYLAISFPIIPFISYFEWLDEIDDNGKMESYALPDYLYFSPVFETEARVLDSIRLHGISRQKLEKSTFVEDKLYPHFYNRRLNVSISRGIDECFWDIVRTLYETTIDFFNALTDLMDDNIEGFAIVDIIEEASKRVQEDPKYKNSTERYQVWGQSEMFKFEVVEKVNHALSAVYKEIGIPWVHPFMFDDSLDRFYETHPNIDRKFQRILELFVKLYKPVYAKMYEYFNHTMKVQRFHSISKTMKSKDDPKSKRFVDSYREIMTGKRTIDDPGGIIIVDAGLPERESGIKKEWEEAYEKQDTCFFPFSVYLTKL